MTLPTGKLDGCGTAEPQHTSQGGLFGSTYLPYP